MRENPADSSQCCAGQNGNRIMAAIAGEWLKVLSPEFKKPYYRQLYNTVKAAYESGPVYPPPQDLYSAFELTPFDKVKVVILGQDPYHGTGQAHGLSFSVRPGVAVPPSLANIYKEIRDDLGIDPPDHGCLTSWAEQGVLLLNTVLTVQAHKPNSHKGIGWEEFTDVVIRALNKEDRPIVFMLWGRNAGAKKDMLDNPKHLVLTAPHPSPYSAYSGFFGCRHFSKANAFLKENGSEEIDWRIPPYNGE